MATQKEWKEQVQLVCGCGRDFSRRRDYIRQREKAGKSVTCTRCSNSAASLKKWAEAPPERHEQQSQVSRAVMLAYKAGLTPEQRSEEARIGGKANKGGTSVQRQWETVRANPELMQQARERLRRTSQNFWDSLTPEERVAHTRKVIKNTGRSVVADRFLERLRNEGVLLEAEHGVSGFIVDGCDVAAKVIVEFYGDNFHCRPTKFTDPDRFCSWIQRTVRQQWARDRKRLGVFYSLGFRVVIVWESDWSENPEREIRRVQDAVRECRENLGNSGSV